MGTVRPNPSAQPPTLIGAHHLSPPFEPTAAMPRATHTQKLFFPLAPPSFQVFARLALPFLSQERDEAVSNLSSLSLRDTPPQTTRSRTSTYLFIECLLIAIPLPKAEPLSLDPPSPRLPPSSRPPSLLSPASFDPPQLVLPFVPQPVCPSAPSLSYLLPLAAPTPSAQSRKCPPRRPLLRRRSYWAAPGTT